MMLRATPFHVRTAAANRSNSWLARNSTTLAAAYDDPAEEALAARAGAIIADLSWLWRVRIEGARAAEFLSRLATRDVTNLAPGAAIQAVWLTDCGGLRGEGVIAREGKESFLLLSAGEDWDWVARAAALFGVAATDISSAQGGLAVIGPFAEAALDAAGIETKPAPREFRKITWRGEEIMLSRFGLGYELWCAPDDAILIWDRILRAGGDYALRPAGLLALDILDIEAGLPKPLRDYHPAHADDAATPSPHAMGLSAHIDQDADFNGRAVLLAAPKPKTKLIGLEIDSASSAPHMPVEALGRVIGRTLHSVYSPALRRGIALAELEADSVVPGNSVSVMLPPSLGRPEAFRVPATIARLPFLAFAAPIEAGSAVLDTHE